MATRLITTVGGAYSNSYVTLKEAETFAVNFPWYDSIVDKNGNTIKGWSDFTVGEQTLSLIQATFALQGIPWKGVRCDPAVDADLPALDWDKYLRIGTIFGRESPFGYFDDGGGYKGSGQGDNVLSWGSDTVTVLPSIKTFKLATDANPIKFFDQDGNELTPDSSKTDDDGTTYIWDTAIKFGGFIGGFTDLLQPLKSATMTWGVFADGEQLLNFPGTTKEQAQRLAWPRSNVTCEGETADCTFIPRTIKNAQVLIAYNFLIRPYLVPGTPSVPPQAPTGTYRSKEKLGDLEVQYTQYDGFDPTADNCTNCNDPYLYKVFDWLSAFLGCWADVQSGDSRMVRLYRN